MENGGKIEHGVFWKKHARRWFIVAYVWLPSSFSAAWHIQIKLVNDNIVDTIQKRNFPNFVHLDILFHARSGVDCFDKLDHVTTECC